MSFRLVKESLLSRVYSTAARDYNRLKRIEDKIKACLVCLIAGRKVEKLTKVRKPLLKLFINTMKTSRIDKRIRPRQTPRGIFGCKLYGIHICNHIACWNEHLKAIPCI